MYMGGGERMGQHSPIQIFARDIGGECAELTIWAGRRKTRGVKVMPGSSMVSAVLHAQGGARGPAFQNR